MGEVPKRYLSLAMAMTLGMAGLVSACAPEPVPPPIATDPIGVVVTPTGVVAPVLVNEGSAFWIRTPCYRMARIEGGTLVGPVDVVLDAGHGGAEDGAPGADGSVEKEVNAAVTERVARLLSRDGVRVLRTHVRDDFLTLHTRGEVITGARPRLAVSIHHNSGTTVDEGGPGTEAIFQERSADSRRLAEHLHRAVVERLRRFPVAWGGDPGRDVWSRRGETGDYYGILRYSAGVPTAIIESGYISNPAEAEFFGTDTYRDADAEAIAAGIRAQLSATPADGSNPTPAPVAVVPPGTLPDPAGLAPGQDVFAGVPVTRPQAGTAAGDGDGCSDPPLD